MEITIVTIHYHPFFFLKESLENNYKIFKKENINFNHYLLDNNYPIEIDQQSKIKDLCEKYNIKYLNSGKNLGIMQGAKYFQETVKPKDLILNLESDVYLSSDNLLSNIEKIHKDDDIENMIFLNNKNLDDYDKNIYKINDVNVFELDIKNLDHTWIQCFHFNNNRHEKIKEILKADDRNNYDVPGEKNNILKEKKIPFLVMSDFHEDMEKYRYQNYFEYEYYKAIVYYWSKFEKQFEKITFEDFIKEYDYYFDMEDKFYSCFKNFKARSKNYVLKPSFYFEKTKNRFNQINTDFIICRVNEHKKKEIKLKIGRV